MGSKQIIYKDEARKALENGINKVADAVKVTLGPRGRVVVVGKQFGSPMVTKDGVSVAKEIELEDHFENLGAQLCREVASKTNDVAGDGTTTATVLAQAMVKEGQRYISSGGNPVAVKKGIESAVACVVEHINKSSKKVVNTEDIKFVATIAGNDPEVGDIVSRAIEKVGIDGVLTLEESSTSLTEITLAEGIQLDKGFLSPYFANVPGKPECVFENPLILLYDGKIDNVQEIIPVLEMTAAAKRALLIIAEDITESVLPTLNLNVIRGAVHLCAIKNPGFGNRRKDFLDDLAALTGGVVISPAAGMSLSAVEVSDFGSSQKVIVTKDNTTLVAAGGNKSAIMDRIKNLKMELDLESSSFEKGKIEERISKLTGGVAVIKVGASTESEMKEKKHRYEDAVAATRAAIEEGIVLGGGVTLLRASQLLDKIKVNSEDEKQGIEIVRRSLESPLKTIAENAGVKGDVIVEQVLNSSGNIGYDASTGKMTDLFKAGIIDPAKVTRNAIQNASSIAILVLTTECLIDDTPKPPSAFDGMMPPGM